MQEKTNSINYLKVWNLSWPIILANVSIPMIGATNIAVLGHLESKDFIAAVALGVVALQFIYWGFSFLRKVTTGLTAQAYGAKQDEERIHILIRNLIIAVFLGLIIILLKDIISDITFFFLDSKPELEKLAIKYFKIRIWAAPAVFCNYVILGWLYGSQKPQTALFLRVGMNLLNIALALYLVIALKMNIYGVAYAAIVSQISFCIIGLIVSLSLIKTKLKDLVSRETQKLILEFSKLKKTFSLNNDIFIRTVLIFIAFSWFTAKGAKQGESILASNTVLLNLFWFLSYALDGFSNAAEALVGEAHGQKSEKAFKKSIKVTTVFAICFALLFSLTYFCFGKNIISLLTNLEEIKAIAFQYLPWMILMPLVSIWCFQLDGIFLGATETKSMRNMMIISFGVYALAMLTLPKYIDNHGLWLSMVIFMIVRGLTLYLCLGKIKA